MQKNEAVVEIRSFNRFYTNIISILDESVLKSGNSLAEARVLFEIAQHDEVCAREILRNLIIDEGYLSRIVNKLILEKLIVKTQSIKDKRQFDLSLSEYGVARLEKLNDLADSATLKLICNINSQDLITLMSSMGKVQSILQKYNDNQQV